MGWHVGPVMTAIGLAGCAGEERIFEVLTYRCSKISAKILSSKFLFLSYSLFLLSFLSHDAPFSQCTYQRETDCPRVMGHNPLRISDLCTGSFLIDLHLIWTLKPIEEAPRAGQPGTSQTSAVCCSLLFFKQILRGRCRYVCVDLPSGPQLELSTEERVTGSLGFAL